MILRQFYDLCTLNLNDATTYTEMRVIAAERYGLNLSDPFLPDGSLDQGVDFIDILRDLNCEFWVVWTLLQASEMIFTLTKLYFIPQLLFPNTITILSNSLL